MKLFRIFLPKKYNDGKPIESKKIREVAEEIRKRFGGYSANPFGILPVMQGIWTSNKGKAYREQVFVIELFVEDTNDNNRWIKAKQEDWRQKFEQEQLFIIVQYAEILNF